MFSSLKIVTIQWCSLELLPWQLSLNLSGEQFLALEFLKMKPCCDSKWMPKNSRWFWHSGQYCKWMLFFPNQSAFSVVCSKLEKPGVGHLFSSFLVSAPFQVCSNRYTLNYNGARNDLWVFCWFAFSLVLKELVQWELAGSGNCRETNLYTRYTVTLLCCSQFSYTNFLQRCLERDLNEEDNITI